MIIKLLITFSIILPTSVHATCPEALQFDKYLILSRVSPYYKHEYFLAGDSIKKKVTSFKRGKIHQNEQKIVNGLIVLERFSTKINLTVSYESSTDEIKNLPEIKEWHSKIKMFKNGIYFKSGIYVLKYIKTTKETIGECAYTVWEVVEETKFKNTPPILFRKFYSPQLRVVLRSANLRKENITKAEIKFDSIKFEEK